MASRNALRHRQRTTGFDCSLHVGQAHGVAIHGRVVVARHIEGRHHVLRQHTAIGIKRRDRLHALHRLHTLEQLRQCVFNKHEWSAGVHVGINRDVEK